MNRVKDNNAGLFIKDAVVGQFQIIEKGDYKETVLADNERNIYPMHTVSVLTSQFSRHEGSIDFPKPFRVKPDGTILETGAKVLIIFPMGKSNPVVLGCLNRLGSQNENSPGLQIDADNLNRKKRITANDDYSYESIEDIDGVQKQLTGGSYSVGVTGGNASMRADTNTTIEGKTELALLGKTVEIGGNLERPVEPPDDLHKNKAEEIFLYGKKIILGHSNARGEEIKEDKKGTIKNPVLQPTVMGTALEALLEILVDELINAKYTGSGIIKMIPTSAIILRQKVRSRLNKIKSKTTFVLYDPKQVQEDKGGLGGSA